MMELPFFHQPARSLRARIGGAAILLVIAGALALSTESWRAGALFALGGLSGALLYHTGFAYLASWRDAIVRREVSGIDAQIILVGASVLLFAAALGRGAAFGMPVAGAAAPLGIAVALGGALFGIGLAFVGDGLALLGALVAAGIGAWLAGLGAAFWAGLPSIGPVLLPELVRWQGAAPIQIGVLILLWTFARVWAGTTPQRPIRPLIAPALALAVLGWAVLVVSGHPWRLVPFGPGVWRMDLAVALGAVAVASFAGKEGWRRPDVKSFAASLAGGLVMGAGAGIAGSNIEALIAAVASGNLSGWLWLASAFGAAVAVFRLRAPIR